MKKGFLLSGKKVPRVKNGSVNDTRSPGEDGHRPQPTTKKAFPSKTSIPGGNLPSHTSSRKIGTPNFPREPKGGMKRGFLLAGGSSDNNIENDNKKSQNLPQCKPEETPIISYRISASEQAIQPKKRISTISTALLDFEKSHNEHDIDDRRNQQSEPVVSSLLRLIEDEPDDPKEGNPPECDNNLVPSDEHNDKPSLDSWINQPSSSQPSLIIPSSSLLGPQRKPFVAKSGKPLIVEVDTPPLLQEVANSSKHSLDSSNESPDPRRFEHPLNISSYGIESTSPKIISDTNAELQNGTAIETHVPPLKDSLQFANDVSLLLAQLCHSIHSKRRSTRESPNKDYVVGVGMFIDKKSTKQIKSFITKHLSRRLGADYVRYAILDNLWKMILEPIAQDYSESIQSRKKKKNTSKAFISPPLGFGLGVVDFIEPAGVAYKSLAKRLSDAAHANKSSNIPQKEDKEKIEDSESDKERRNKQLKILALGAVYLLRCRIRCIGVTMTNLENGIDLSNASYSDDDEGIGAVLKDLQSEIRILLSKILPTLESIVRSDAKEGRTILVSSAADACFELIETSSRAVVLQHMLQVRTTKGNKYDKDFNWSTPKSMQIWRDTLPLIERLLAVKQGWVSRSTTTERISNGPSRVKCAVAVLDDWLDVVKTSKRFFFNLFVGDDWRDERADFTEGLNLFWNLSGISLKRVENADSLKSSCFRVGGMAQSLCQRQECAFGSSVNAFLHDLGGGVEAEDLVLLIQKSAKFTDSIRTAIKTAQSPEAWTKANHQRAAIRAFASWLFRVTKAIRTLTKKDKRTDGDGIDFLGSAMGSLVVLLRSESKQCVDISVATL